MQRILVVRLSSIGDIVHALPAVAALGQSSPETRIDWVIESRYAELLRDNPFVHRVIPIDTLGWRKSWGAPETWQDAIRSLRAIRTLRPDVALDFQGLLKSALVARISRARRRIGFRGRWLRESLAGVLYTEGVHAEGRTHVVEENLALVERLGVRAVSREEWRFPLPGSAEVERRVVERLAALGAREIIVVNPGGGWSSKRWPPDQYAELIRELGGLRGYHVLVTGSPAEESLISSILQRAGSLRAFYFPSTLVEFIVLTRRARLFVGGDTGPMHIAAAAGTPVVAVYGPTNPARNGPFRKDDVTVWNNELGHKKRGYAHWGSGRKTDQVHLEGIPTEKVWQAVLSRLAYPHGS